MKVTATQTTGNSSKFLVNAKRGDFTIALSFTLRTKIWKLPDAQAELAAAEEIAEAIVSRHDPLLPFKSLYVFAEHNTEPSLEKEIQQLRKYGFNK